MSAHPDDHLEWLRAERATVRAMLLKLPESWVLEQCELTIRLEDLDAEIAELEDDLFGDLDEVAAIRDMSW